MAYCQPPLIMRDRILTELDIRGLNACPDKVDIGAIRLVYDLANYSRNDLVTVQPALTTPIAFGTSYAAYIYHCNTIPLPPNRNYPILSEKLVFLYCRIALDAAGRAALALGPYDVRMHLRFWDATAAVLIEISNATWEVTPSVGVAWDGVAGTHITSLGAAASAHPAPNTYDFVLNEPLEFRHSNGGFLVLQAETTDMLGFPPNSTLDVNAIYSFK